MLCGSGVDTSRFTAGGVRPAAVSKARAMALPITCVLSQAGWTLVCAFAKFYDKRFVPDVVPFQEAVLILILFLYGIANIYHCMPGS